MILTILILIILAGIITVAGTFLFLVTALLAIPVAAIETIGWIVLAIIFLIISIPFLWLRKKIKGGKKYGDNKKNDRFSKNSNNKRGSTPVA